MPGRKIGVVDLRGVAITALNPLIVQHQGTVGTGHHDITAHALEGDRAAGRAADLLIERDHRLRAGGCHGGDLAQHAVGAVISRHACGYRAAGAVEGDGRVVRGGRGTDRCDLAGREVVTALARILVETDFAAVGNAVGEVGTIHVVINLPREGKHLVPRRIGRDPGNPNGITGDIVQNVVLGGTGIRIEVVADRRGKASVAAEGQCRIGATGRIRTEQTGAEYPRN